MILNSAIENQNKQTSRVKKWKKNRFFVTVYYYAHVSYIFNTRLQKMKPFLPMPTFTFLQW